MRLVMKISNRIHVLDQGRTLAEGRAAEVRANPAVIAAYLGTGAAAKAAHA
jgi:branched-chain amino acid transport system ATP-binding protein